MTDKELADAVRAEIERLMAENRKLKKALTKPICAVCQCALGELNSTVKCADCGEKVTDLQAHCEREDNICLIHDSVVSDNSARTERWW